MTRMPHRACRERQGEREGGREGEGEGEGSGAYASGGRGRSKEDASLTRIDGGGFCIV
jgi:hypothetical protein